MLIDTIAFIFLLIAIYKGLKNGLIVAIFSFVAFVVGIAAALAFSSAVASYLESSIHISRRLLPFLAFLIVFLLVLFLIRAGARFIEKLVQLAWLGWVNKIGGILFYLLLYFFTLSTLLFYAVQLHLIKEDAIRSSLTYGTIQPIAPWLMGLMGTFIPAVKNAFGQLFDFFQNHAGKKQ
jgi:membrane protein required for colicin V production